MKIINKKLFPFVLALIFSSFVSACGPSSLPTETPSENPTELPSENPSEEPTENPTITLKTPVLNLDNKTGNVTWQHVENADFYRYYINDQEFKTLTQNEFLLTSGSTFSVCAESSNPNIISSDWSKPVTYFEETTNEFTEYVQIHFYNANMSSITIGKGSTYQPNNPKKTHYSFNGWYLDPFYKNELKKDHIFNKNTILYPNFIEDDLLRDVTYWIKCNQLFSSDITYPSNTWQFIPLHFDQTKSSELGKRVFSSIVSVNGTTSTSYAEYIVMDGIIDNDGRTYFKNGDANFHIKTDGTYKIYFSAEYSWSTTSTAINVYAEQLSSSNNYLYNENRMPQFALDSSNELDTVQLKLDSANEQVSWDLIENATFYEYIIDNGNIETTTSNNLILYPGSHVIVRANTTKPGYLPSRWSNPVKQEVLSYPSSVNVYFYGCNRTNIKIPYGSTIDRPVNNPVKPGYTFDNWYVDLAHTKLFDFNSKLYENTVIYANFIYDNEPKFTLVSSNKITRLATFTISNQFGYNEYKATYTLTNDLTVYVRKLEDGKLFGPYEMSTAGEYTMYFSEEHKWDLGTENERNAYWTGDEITIYFTNNIYWSSVYCYTWDSNNDYKKAWPGDVMTWSKTNSYGQDIYKITLSTKYKEVIFNDGNGSQTVDISIDGIKDGTGFYTTTKNSSGKYEVSSFEYK